MEILSLERHDWDGALPARGRGCFVAARGGGAGIVEVGGAIFMAEPVQSHVVVSHPHYEIVLLDEVAETIENGPVLVYLNAPIAMQAMAHDNVSPGIDGRVR